MTRRSDERAIVNGLWIGPRLGAMQRCSIQSFLDHGYEYRLHTYGDVADVPSGATLIDARSLVPETRIWRYRDYDSPAGFSNEFRYRLLDDCGGTWADLDVVCIKPLPDDDYILPAQQLDSAPAATCLLRAPAGCDLLSRARATAEAVDPATAVWGETGPGLLSRLAVELELTLLPVEAVCAINFPEWQLFLAESPDQQGEARRRVEQSFAVHLWHEMWRRAGIDADAVPPAGSLYADLLDRFPTPANSHRRWPLGSRFGLLHRRREGSL